MSMPPSNPLLTIRTAVVLLTAILVGLVAGGLGFLAHHDAALGALTGGGAAAGALILFHDVLGAESASRSRGGRRAFHREDPLRDVRTSAVGDDDREDDPAHLATPASSHRSEAASIRSEGELEEFIAFYRVAAPRLVAFVRSLGARYPDAAECAQEALFLAFTSWPTIRQPYPWCRTVARRVWIRRLESREDPTEDPETAGEPLFPCGTDFDLLEQRHAVLRALGQLPPRQREVMAWHYDGASHSEIAEALGISPEAVRSNLRKARTALRRYLQGNRGEI
jgi:RNA polymerase sigma factor (sigma-70 family)